MPQYLLSIYQPDGPRPEPEFLEPILRDLRELRQDMRDQGVWVFSAGLHAPETATVVRSRDGSVTTTDGPFTEGKEHLGGFTIVEAPDLDAALDWGTRLADATTLPVEVRPFVEER
jgi:hypothetical protein